MDYFAEKAKREMQTADVEERMKNEPKDRDTLEDTIDEYKKDKDAGKAINASILVEEINRLENSGTKSKKAQKALVDTDFFGDD